MSDQLTQQLPLAPDARNRKDLAVWIVSFAVVGIAAMFIYSLLANDVINPDPPAFALAAKRMLAGQKLYRDFFEAKPPLATLAYAIPGLIAPRSYLALQFSMVVVMLIEAGLWFWAFRPSFLAGAVCLIFLVFFPLTYWDFAWPSTEHFSNVFITLELLVALLIVRDGQITLRRCLLAGAATCAAFHFRQNTLLFVLVPVYAVLAARQSVRIKLKGLLWIIGGGLAAWAVVLLIVACVSDFRGYFFQTFIFPFRFASLGGMEARRQLCLYILDEWLAVMLMLAAILAMLAPRWSQRGLALVALGVSLLACVITPRDHVHYWVNSFPAVTLCFLLGLPKDRVTTFLREMVTATAVGIPVALGAWQHMSVAMQHDGAEQFDRIVERIDAQAGKDDTLYVWGPMCSEYLSFRAKPLPAQKYAIGWEVDWNDGLLPDSSEQIIHSYLERPPTIFVMLIGYENKLRELEKGVPRHPAPSVRLAAKLLANNRYRFVESVGGYSIYRRQF